MKTFSSLTLLLLTLPISFSSCGSSNRQNDTAETDTVVAGVSPLHVEGRYLLNADGDTVVLTGPSVGWHGNWGRFYNEGTIKALKEKWGANVTRAAIGAHKAGDITKAYDPDSAYSVNLASTVIDAAIANDMYIICDWHSHDNTLDNAKEFFTVMTEKYGDSPNVIYEIWNEPLEIPWQEVKDYANELIPVIRKNAPSSVIIVGTPRWDQEVDAAAESPLEFDNLLYSLHFYADTHKEWNRSKAEKAIEMGLPLIVSECGSMNHLGDGDINYESWNEWIDFADKNKLSVLMWDIADKDETCSMLTPDAPDNGMEWTDAQLKPWAKLAQETIKKRNGR